jgi:hypothetical protein
MASATLIYDDDGHDATVRIPFEGVDEGTIYLEARRNDGGGEFTLMLTPTGALEIAAALIAAVDGCGALELAEEALNAN